MAKKDKKKEDEYKEENLENSSAQDDEDFGLPDLDEDFDADDDKDEIVVEETVQDELVTLEDEDDSAEESTFDTGETSEPVTFESHEEEEVIEEEYEDDDYETEEGSGDGIENVIIRIALILSNLSWDSALEDRFSSKFNQVSNDLRSEISNIYANFPGRQIVTGDLFLLCLEKVVAFKLRLYTQYGFIRNSVIFFLYSGII